MSGSPPWQIDDWDLGADLAKIADQWSPLRSLLEDEALFDRADPEISTWTCGQQVGHAVLIARSIAERVEGNLDDPDRHSDGVAHEVAERIFIAGHFKRGSAQSPREGLPEGHSRKEFLAMLPGVIAAWERITARASEIPDHAARDRHFALGYLTSAEWVRLGAVHTAHHLRIVRDIVGEAAIAQR